MGFKNSIITTLNSLGEQFSKHGPDILLGIGLVTGAATVYSAVKETLQVEDIIDDAKNELDELKGDETKPASAADITKVYLKTGGKLVANYAPAIALGTTSAVCLLASHGMMKKQTAQVIAAYNTLDGIFKRYRKRVIEEYGEDVDNHLRFGTVQDKVTVIDYDENGNQVESKKKVNILPENLEGYSEYARFFDDSNLQWSRIPEANILNIESVARSATDNLLLRGHVFLNEVYDMLGLERSKEGQVVGWAKGKGDDRVIISINDIYKLATNPESVKKYEHSLLLDFNVDGVIIDQI